VVDLAVVAVEHDGDPLLAGELVAQTLPTQVDALGLELDAQGVDQVVANTEMNKWPSTRVLLWW